MRDGLQAADRVGRLQEGDAKRRKGHGDWRLRRTLQGGGGGEDQGQEEEVRQRGPTMKDRWRLMTPSLSSPCLPDKWYQAS